MGYRYLNKSLFIAFFMVTLGGVLGTTACKNRDKAPDRQTSPEPAEKPAEKKSLALLLALAQFHNDEQGKTTPGPAKLIILRQSGDTFRPEILEDNESLVFHKAYCPKETGAKGGIITIGASKAALKYWQRGTNGHLEGQKLYEGRFGGKWDRLRDIEEGDLDGDGTPEQVLATHDQGVILVGKKSLNTNMFQYQEVMRQEQTFIHEIEIGDLDGAGLKEFYATPSAPNKLGVSQSGRVIRGRFDSQSQKWQLDEIATFNERHAKEILTYDFDGDGKDELYISLEARLGEHGQVLEPLEIRQITMDNSGKLKEKTIATLPGNMARVLTPVHLQKDKAQLLVTTMSAGIFILTPKKEGPWPHLVVDSTSQGFEHAALAIDSDGDGIDEIFVAADKLSTFSEYKYVAGEFNKKVIMRLNPRDIVWNITACTIDEVP